jgi:hypothetical protein
MPNWCNNTVEIYHDDPAMIERARKAFNDGKFLDEFIPVPLSLRETIAGSYGDNERQALLEAAEQDNLNNHGYKNWYDFCVNEWGTKWDVGADGYDADDIPGGLMLTFDSAWAPPCAAYEKLMNMGFRIRAMYYEPGMAFAGIWDNGDDDFYEYGEMNSKEIADTLPVELDDAYGISEAVAEWEEENKEEENE